MWTPPAELGLGILSAHALNVCEPVSDAREPVSAFCAGKRFPGGGDGRC